MSSPCFPPRSHRRLHRSMYAFHTAPRAPACGWSIRRAAPCRAAQAQRAWVGTRAPARKLVMHSALSRLLRTAISTTPAHRPPVHLPSTYISGPPGHRSAPSAHAAQSSLMSPNLGNAALRGTLPDPGAQEGRPSALRFPDQIPSKSTCGTRSSARRCTYVASFPSLLAFLFFVLQKGWVSGNVRPAPPARARVRDPRACSAFISARGEERGWRVRIG